MIEGRLPMKVFERFGLPQPSWFRVEGCIFEDRMAQNPNEDRFQHAYDENEQAEFGKVPVHACMAFLDKDQDSKLIYLPPRLYNAFRDFKYVWIKPVYLDKLTPTPDHLKQYLMDQLPIHFPLSIGPESGIQLV